MPKFALLLVVCLLLCSCSQGQEKTFETETESATISETSSETSSVSSAEATEIDATPIIAEKEITTETTTETDIEYGEYVYSPPQEVLDTHFYCDDIDKKIEWEIVLNEDEKGKFEGDYISTDDMPEFIVEDMKDYSLKNSYYAERHSEEYGEPYFGMRYMLYDMNDDGIDDYIVRAVRSYIWNPDYEFFYKVYITQEDGSYIPVAWDCLEKFNNIQYILKTKTNGLRDMMVLQNSNYPIITYDGGDSYTKFYDSDERHTFLTAKILPNNILHLNMNISAIDAPVGEYYTAIKFADNPYLKNNMLYTCYPDGTPRSYIFKPIGESLPTDFHPSQEGYDFYVEVNEDMRSEFDYYKDLLEIKYIAVNDDNNH